MSKFPRQIVHGGSVYKNVGDLVFKDVTSYNRLVAYVHTDSYPLTKMIRCYDKETTFSGKLSLYVLECFVPDYWRTLPTRLIKANNVKIKTELEE